MNDNDLFNVYASSGDSILVKRDDLESMHSFSGVSGSHFVIDEIPYHFTNINVDTYKKHVSFWLKGVFFEFQIEDTSDRLIKALGMDVISSDRIQQISAPMPGLVIDVLVHTDQKVSAGEPLLVLQAMKMENVIKAPVDFQVAQVLVAKGDNVIKDANMIMCKDLDP